MSLQLRPVARVFAKTRRFPWYPGLIAAAFVLGPSVAGGAALEAASRPLLAALGVGLGSVFVALVLTHDEDLSGAYGLFVVLATLYSHDVLLPLALTITGLALLVERRARPGQPSRVPWLRVTEGFNVFAVVLVAVQIGRLPISALTAPQPIFDSAWNLPVAPTETPDIFLVMLDGHGRADVLRESFDYDPAPFIDGLVSLGFELAPASQSNYMVTSLSLATMFSAAHVYDLGQRPQDDASLQLILAAIARNPAFSLLRRVGYETVAFSAGYEGVAVRHADRFIDDGMPNEAELGLMSISSVGRFVNAFAPNLSSEGFRTRTRDTFAQLPQLAAEPHARPQFVFAHVALPHFPYVFGPACEPRNEPDGTGAILVRLTADQTRCVDSLALASIRALVSADPGAVVIVFSDHGPDARLDWFTPSQEALHERFANLLLARTPGRDHLFAPDTTLVNLLPILFNEYLGTTLPMRPDDQYIGRFSGGPLTRRSPATTMAP